MKQGLTGLGIILLAVVGFTLYSGLFTVHQTQQALVLQFGEAKRVIKEPGLQFKIPFIQNVRFLDKRTLAVNSPPQEIIAADQKRLVVDAFALYKIEDPLRFYQTVNNQTNASLQLDGFINGAIRRVLGNASFEDIVRDDRLQLMQNISSQVNNQTAGLGVRIVDIRIRRADLPDENSEAIYTRMQTERQQEAAEFRAQGEEIARRIRSRADRDVTVLLAEAERDSQQIRGTGDATRNAVFNDAFGRDPDFFSFYRSMQAYEQALQGSNTRLVISPDSELFRFFGDPLGKNGPVVQPSTSSQPVGPVGLNEPAALPATE